MSEFTLTTDMIFEKLAKRVSNHDAKLILNSAIVRSGLNPQTDSQLTSETAKSLCLALINNGGPAFQVGKDVYQEYLQ